MKPISSPDANVYVALLTFVHLRLPQNLVIINMQTELQ